jgi:hypothetical protein
MNLVLECWSDCRFVFSIGRMFLREHRGTSLILIRAMNRIQGFGFFAIPQVSNGNLGRSRQIPNQISLVRPRPVRARWANRWGG